MSKPLVTIETERGECWEVFLDSSYRGPSKVKSIRINLPEQIAYSREVREAAAKANQRHSVWARRGR